MTIKTGTPFLQRIGLDRVRPRQNSSIDIPALQSQKTPIPYPIEGIMHMPTSRTLEPEHGVQRLWPWNEKEIRDGSNEIKVR